MSFPSLPPSALGISDTQENECRTRLLLSAFGLRPQQAQTAQSSQTTPTTSCPFVYVGQSDFDLVVEVSRNTFADIRTRSVRLDDLARLGGRGILLTCVGGKHDPGPALGYSALDEPTADFVSRCFFPSVGVPEDPVTGRLVGFALVISCL